MHPCVIPTLAIYQPEIIHDLLVQRSWVVGLPEHLDREASLFPDD
jgi:hypothetical protein